MALPRTSDGRYWTSIDKRDGIYIVRLWHYSDTYGRSVDIASEARCEAKDADELALRWIAAREPKEG